MRKRSASEPGRALAEISGALPGIEPCRPTLEDMALEERRLDGGATIPRRQAPRTVEPPARAGYIARMLNDPTEILWAPRPDQVAASRLAAYQHWLQVNRGLAFDDYHALWRWSVDRTSDFWREVWDLAGIVGSRGATVVREGRRREGADGEGQGEGRGAAHVSRGSPRACHVGRAVRAETVTLLHRVSGPVDGHGVRPCVGGAVLGPSGRQGLVGLGRPGGLGGSEPGPGPA